MDTYCKKIKKFLSLYIYKLGGKPVAHDSYDPTPM